MLRFSFFQSGRIGTASLLAILIHTLLIQTLVAAGEEGSVDFNRDIRPILSRHCFACHGPDEEHRQAELRLDSRQFALSAADSGLPALVPGEPDESELMARISSPDPAMRMPPEGEGKPLAADQIEKLRHWIAEGAAYAEHWSFRPVRYPALPPVEQRRWPASPIDYFVLARLEQAGLKPQAHADRFTLIRRLSFDLRGLPPTPEEVQAFLRDGASQAYERLVDRFLQDPAFGERWARLWLDLARYADSRGYGSDPLRPHIWRYRDWVIGALNRNLPFDEFTVEQLAGDLLPDPTLDQLIATAFHRNTMTNTEGGTDDEEFRVAAVRDRVDTTMQVWMGLTMGCAKCHNHKYDPISQRDYYALMDFFNQTADSDRTDEAPTIAAPTPRQLRIIDRIDRRIKRLRSQLDAARRELAEASPSTVAVPQPRGRYVRIEIPGKKKILSLAEVQVLHPDGKNVALEGKASQSSTAFGGIADLAIDNNTDGNFNAAASTTHTTAESDPWWEVDLGDVLPIDQLVIFNRTDGRTGKRLANFQLAVLDANRQVVWQRRVARPPAPRTAIQVKPPHPLERRIAALERQISDEQQRRPQAAQVPIMQDLPADQRRSTHMMERGDFLSLGARVQAAVPAAFAPLPAAAPRNRLGVAYWLVDQQNPLTARVTVNRLWSQLFGAGLVKTEEDFGTQGEQPSHPQLLDWLATDFMAHDWDVKRILRVMVTSQTYQQSSRVTDELQRLDPQNRLLGRGPRFRLEAEMVRDQALAVGGLLSRKMYGPSVYPPQPPGLWRAAFNGRDRQWATAEDEDRWRRGVYTFWRRTMPYPSMATFDAPSREICTLRRIRTTTPLQALVTLNDPVYVEAAQGLARRILHHPAQSVEQRCRFALQLCLVRQPSHEQVTQLVELYRHQWDFYQAHRRAAEQVAGQLAGDARQIPDPSQCAAWTIVASVLLNMDAVLTKG